MRTEESSGAGEQSGLARQSDKLSPGLVRCWFLALRWISQRFHFFLNPPVALITTNSFRLISRHSVAIQHGFRRVLRF